MAEAEAGVRYVRGNDLVRPECQESALPLAFFHHPKGKAGWFGGEEVAHELPVDGKPGQQRINVTHGLSMLVLWYHDATLRSCPLSIPGVAILAGHFCFKKSRAQSGGDLSGLPDLRS